MNCEISVESDIITNFEYWIGYPAISHYFDPEVILKNGAETCSNFEMEVKMQDNSELDPEIFIANQFTNMLYVESSDLSKTGIY